MGCDIHIFLEVLNSKTKKFHLFESKGFGLQELKNDTSYDKYRIYPDGRNYSVFSVLADVRSYESLPHLDEPRGVPNDASSGYLKKVEDYGSDGHSHSWFTVEELLNNNNDLYEEVLKITTASNDPWDFRDMPFFQWVKFLGEQGIPHEHLRVCFYFDN